MKKLVIATATVAAISLSAITTLPAAAQADKSSAVMKLNMSAVPDLDRDNVRKIQESLDTKGFNPGPIDGIVGPRTRAAVSKFQDHFGMKATGEIDNQMLFALGRVDIAAH